MSGHVWSCLIMSRHVWSCQDMFDHVRTCKIMSDHVGSCQDNLTCLIMSDHVKTCLIMSGHLKSCRIMSGHFDMSDHVLSCLISKQHESQYSFYVTLCWIGRHNKLVIQPQQYIHLLGVRGPHWGLKVVIGWVVCRGLDQGFWWEVSEERLGLGF